ncbi:MAG TPA: hypothetical protein VGA31_13115 [Thermoanaerobaculia bacterium]
MRRRPGPQFILAFGLAPVLFASSVSGQDLRVSAGTIEDRRTTGEFFGGLEIELKLTGDDLADARAARVTLTKAQDEGGRDLLPEKKGDEDFQKSSSGRAPDLKINLKNPARGASAIKEISGEVQLFAPSRDPAATIVIDRLVSRMDKPIDSSALKSQQIKARLVSPKVYRAQAKKRDAELEAEMQKHKEEMKKEAGDDKTAEALMALVKGFAGMMNDVGDNDVILQIEDPQGKLLDVEVVGASGVIDTRGSMSSGGLKILQYSEKLPPDAKLRFLVKTKNALLRAPFSLTNVPLP